MQLDIDDQSTVERAIDGADLVVHTAGPFQRKGVCSVLQAAIRRKVPYLDVCDDTSYAKMARGMAGEAQAAGVPCITTGGIYPGVSNVMAAYMVEKNRRDGEKPPDRVLYSL